jgi:hypothetical protein
MVPLTLFAFVAAFAGLALTDTIPSALIWTALLAAGAGDWWAIRRAGSPVASRQRVIGAVAVLAATYVMVIPALVVLLFIAYAI